MSEAYKKSMQHQEDRKREIMRLALKDMFDKGIERGDDQSVIDSNLSSLKRILENQYGIPFSMYMGGPVEGIASLSDTARDMYRGPRGIGAYQQFTEGGGAKSPEMQEGLEDMIRMGLGSSKSLAREGKEAFSEGEYERAASKYLMSILGKFPITKEFYSGLGSILQRSDTPTDALKNIIYDEEGRFLGASRDFIKSKVKGYAEGGEVNVI